MATKAAGLLAALALGLGAAARADVWDLGTDNDDDTGSDNEIVHGISQVHDLGAQAAGTVEDEDWYPLNLAHGRSIEVRVEGITGDLSNGPASPIVELRTAAGVFVQGAELATDFGRARSLRFASTSSGTIGHTSYFVRVANPACATGCTGDDEYRIRAYDTTLALPRFNNTGGQVTVLILQNPTSRPIFYVASAWTNGGVYLGSFGSTVAPYATAVTNVGTVNSGELANQSGSLVIRNNGPYQGLAGKGVAVEPATGFTFDTALTAAPQ